MHGESWNTIHAILMTGSLQEKSNSIIMIKSISMSDDDISWQWLRSQSMIDVLTFMCSGAVAVAVNSAVQWSAVSCACCLLWVGLEATWVKLTHSLWHWYWSKAMEVNCQTQSEINVWPGKEENIDVRIVDVEEVVQKQSTGHLLLPAAAHHSHHPPPLERKVTK